MILESSQSKLPARCGVPGADRLKTVPLFANPVKDRNNTMAVESLNQPHEASVRQVHPHSLCVILYILVMRA